MARGAAYHSVKQQSTIAPIFPGRNGRRIDVVAWCGAMNPVNIDQNQVHTHEGEQNWLTKAKGSVQELPFLSLIRTSGILR